MDAFVGMPQESVLTEFIQTALLLESIKHDESIMQELLNRVKDYINKKEFEAAEKALVEGLSYENWKEKFGT